MIPNEYTAPPGYEENDTNPATASATETEPVSESEKPVPSQTETPSETYNTTTYNTEKTENNASANGLIDTTDNVAADDTVEAVDSTTDSEAAANSQSARPSRKSVNSFADLPSLFSNQDTTETDSSQSDTPAPHAEYTDHYKNTYDIIATMMYLVGVKEDIFQTHVPDIMPIYESLQKNDAARIIRNLCMVRTSLLNHFKNIAYLFRYELRNLSSTPEYIPTEAVTELERANIYIQKSKPDIYQYVMAINLEISNRINNVSGLFPEWLNWSYVRQVFLMPNGFRENGAKAGKKEYSSRRNEFPYQCYLNWPRAISGNIFHHDYKFVTSLYEMHGDKFENVSLVRDAGEILMGNLYDFINGHKKIIIVVDCENSDPVKLAAALSSLTASQRWNIHKVMLFDSNHTTAAWTTLCNTGITKEFDMEHIIVERLYEHKSQVDMTLAAHTCREIYQNGADSVILISSDSDYWALIKALPETDFLVMLEKEKSGKTIRDALDSQSIVHCYIDDFCTAASHAIITKTILGTLQQQFDEMVHFNAREMLDEVLKSTWLTLSDREKEIFYNRYLKRMRLEVDSNGDAKLVMGA